MRRVIELVVACGLLAACAGAADLEIAALTILTGRPASAGNCFAADAAGARVGVIGSEFTMSAVRSITNRADVLALAEQKDAEASAPTPMPNGIEAPVLYIPDISIPSNGLALVAVNGEPVWVAGWGSPRHTLATVTNDATKAANTNAILRAELRYAIRESQTNADECVAIRNALTNLTAQAQAVIFPAAYNRATESNAWKIVVNALQESRKEAAKLADVNRELIDHIRWMRQHIGDSTPE
jgi:hypothetical protein